MAITKNKPFVTRTGRVLSDAEIGAIADEVAGDIDVEALKPRRRGRPKLEGGPADVVAVLRSLRPRSPQFCLSPSG